MAVEQGDADFQSKLDEASKERAKEELGEKNEKDREIAVQSFREWVIQQRPWLKTPTDFEFLLRFVRARKYSLLLARDTIENYWTCKSQTPKWFQNIDPADKTIQEILKTGFYACPKKTDKNGRRYVFEKPGLLDLSKVKTWKLENVFKTIVLICEWINRDENLQVNGLHIFADMTGMTMGHASTLWSRENSKKIMKYYQNSLPCRMKGLHLYNEPGFFDTVFALIKPLMKQKSKDRMHLHGQSMVNVYKHMDMSVLPNEYLPDDYGGPRIGTWQQIVDDMIEDIMKPEFQNYMKEISNPKYGVDLSLKPGGDVPVGSFRKLNVD